MEQMPNIPPKFLKPYDPTASEPAILGAWEKSGYANPDVCIEKGVTAADAEPYAIVLPPPNVTGTLHMGHAAMLAIEDILIRYARMKGKRTLWIPGTDSAALATQSKVEEIIYKTEKKTRHDLGREELMKRIDAFTQESKDAIIGQVKALGASLDWSRYAYTMDDMRNRAVAEAFVRMYDAGLIYRGDRIVNWDPKLQTSCSDDEIEYVEQKDTFYHFQYGPFEIGTVRPETKFGDKYVVMHPDDTRYAQFTHGQKIELEWINGPIVATIIKDSAVEMEFGSGAMTITPAHSGIDFEIAQRHGLDIERVIDDRGILLPIAGEFAGQHIKKVRPLIVEKLRAKGLITKEDEGYVHNVATNSRGGGTIEPQIKRQWFIAVNKEFTIPHSEIPSIPGGSLTTLKGLMRTAVESGATKIAPERFEKIYYHWIDNLRDWCISRQIWFGHRVPVWYRTAGKPTEIIYFVHGTTTDNENDISTGHDHGELSELGKQQNDDLKEALKDMEVDVVICSDLKRAHDTAQTVFGGRATIIADARLRECDYGDLNGGSEHIVAPQKRSHIDTPFPNGESYRDIETRVRDLLNELSKKYLGKKIAFVSHQGPQLALDVILKGKTWEQAFDEDWRHKKAWQPGWTYELKSTGSGTEIYCGVNPPEGDGWEQDPDTLDTWFSSGLWTFSTLGWPDETPDLQTYHPTAVLETGYDILFFWVARMVLMSGFLRGQVPFKNVYLHGLVRDAKGRKMSKSLGNIIDPLDMSTKYGADATRLSLIIGAQIGNDLKLSEDRVRGYKHFANKLWNISRFVLENAQGVDMTAPLTDTDAGLIAEAEGVVASVSSNIDGFRLDLAADEVYHFVWGRFAAEILEQTKPIMRGEDEAAKASAQRMLYTILIMSLKLLHPFMPFVTEAIWQELPEKEIDLLMVAKWPA